MDRTQDVDRDCEMNCSDERFMGRERNGCAEREMNASKDRWMSVGKERKKDREMNGSSERCMNRDRRDAWRE